MNINWSSINYLGKTKALNASYYLIFLLPIISKIISYINNFDSLEIEKINKLVLPINMQLLFYTSLFSSIGKSIYTTRCPEIIKKFNTYLDFEDMKIGQYFYKKILDCSYRKKKLNNDEITKISNYIVDKIDISMQMKFFNFTFIDDKESEIFYFLYDLYDSKNKYSLYASVFFYTLSFLCLLSIIIHNTIIITNEFYSYVVQ